MTPQEIAIQDEINFLSRLESIYLQTLEQIIERKAKLERAVEEE